MAVGALPVAKVRQDEQSYRSIYRDNLTKSLHEISHNSKGLPAGVQVIGKSHCEEQVLGLMKLIEKSIK